MSSSADETLRGALAALGALRARLEALEAARVEPIAIVGIGCRFPGGANGPTEFWRLLQPASASPQFVVGSFGIDRVPEA